MQGHRNTRSLEHRSQTQGLGTQVLGKAGPQNTWPMEGRATEWRMGVPGEVSKWQPGGHPQTPQGKSLWPQVPPSLTTLKGITTQTQSAEQRGTSAEGPVLCGLWRVDGEGNEKQAGRDAAPTAPTPTLPASDPTWAIHPALGPHEACCTEVPLPASL